MILACLVVNQGFAEDLDGDTTKTNLAGDENIDIKTYTLTLDNTDNSVYSGILSGTGQVIVTKGNWNSTTQLTLSPNNGYANFTGSVILQEGYTSEHEYAEGKLELAAANIFSSASSITNDGTLIVSASQVLPNLRGSGKIQINSDVQTLTFNNTSDTDYAGSIEGATNLIKTGIGELTLSHDNGFPSFTGSITVDEGSLILEKWNMFRISPPTVTNNAKIMVGGGEQVFKNLSGSGDIEIETNTDLISIYENDCIISGKIIGGADHTEFEKKGPGTLTLTGANEFSGYIKIDEGKIIFKGDAIECNEKIEGNVVPGTNRVVGDVEFYTEGTKFICIPDDSKHILVKSIEKTGDSDSILQIYEGATGCVRAESFVISSGRLDYGGYFQSIPPEGQELGIFDVIGGTTFSPGLTVDNSGEVVDTIGRITISNEARLKIEESALALFEFDAYNEEGLKFDNVVFQHENSTFVAADGTIDLAFLSNDVWKWAQEGAEHWIVNDHGFKDKEGNPIPEGVSVNYDNWLRDTYKDYFSLEGRYNGLYLVGKGAPEPPAILVPEPSSWALLIGGLLTFLLFLKKKQG